MGLFDRPRGRKGRNREWVNGIVAEDAQAPNYYNQLVSNEIEVHQNTRTYMENYDKALKEFKQRTSLTALDISFLIVAATIQTLRWALVSNDRFRLNNASDADKILDDFSDSTREKEYIPATIKQIITDFSTHTVPYDAIQRSSRFIEKNGDERIGIGGSNHRYMTLGHDPLAGLIVGTANIATNTLTVNNWRQAFPSYHVKNQQIDENTDFYHVMDWTGEILLENPEVIGASLIHQIVHCGTDVFTKQGLPVPFINVVSPETSKWLVRGQIDLYSVTRGALLSILINKLIGMCHRLFFDRQRDDIRLFDIRTNKILTYSSILSSTLNIVYVGISRDVKRLDIGGILITLWRILNDIETTRKIREEFVRQVLDHAIDKEVDEVNQKLAKWGFSI